jgi:hypothetical protein
LKIFNFVVKKKVPPTARAEAEWVLCFVKLKRETKEEWRQAIAVMIIYLDIEYCNNLFFFFLIFFSMHILLWHYFV